MAKTTRQQRIETAGDDCRDNAHSTVVEQMGLKAYQALDFNGRLNADTLETIAQAGYFADQHGVTKAEVLAYLNIEL